MPVTRKIWLWALIVALTAAVHAAQAVPLDVPACDSLKKERTELEGGGILMQLHVTPDEAKALPKDRIERLAHYADISAQILFRCVPPPEPVVEPVKPVAKAAAVQPKRKFTGFKKRRH